MGSINFSEEETKELLDAQAHIWSHIFYFLNSMALKCALELGIPDTIQKHGNPMTIEDLANSLHINPNKIPSLSRLIRLLVSSNFLSKKNVSNGEEVFELTLSSQLLLKDHPLSQAPFALGVLSTLIEPSNRLSSWFQSEDVETPYHIAHGKSLWGQASHDPVLNKSFNQAMESDSRFVTSLLVKNNHFKGLLQGTKSLVDVGGGNGTTARAISEAYPSLECTVLDLPHVIEQLQENNNNNNNVVYVAGDMFEAVPHADAVLLKWILHDWSDDDCINILLRCKEAIPNKRQGGKVIIIDIVVDLQGDDSKHSNTQHLFDIGMMSMVGEGKERTEEEWKKLFVKAGFGDYKILPILGL